MKTDYNVNFIISTLNLHGFEAYMVGGCVRDMLLHRPAKDIDICTNALPLETINCFKNHKIIETGLKHGTITLMLDKTPYEITTFRTDGEYLDNRRPLSVQFVSSLKEDLMRRDFTINAMAFCEKKGVIDYFDGKKHLSERLICAVLQPDIRFNEDSLRIMRGLRFASELDFSIEDNTAKSILKNKYLLKNIALERINIELSKLLTGKNPYAVLCDYRDVFAVFIPEIREMFDFLQHNPHHLYDVWIHTITAISKSKNDIFVRLALLFHDIGKPRTFSLDENGVGHFYGHAKLSHEIAKAALKRLKFDNKTIETVLLLIKYHDNVIEPTKKSVKRMLNKLGYENFLRLIEVKKGDNLAQGAINLQERFASYDIIISILDEIIAENECFSIKSLEINGNDLIKLGFSPGKQIGNILNEVFEKVLDESLKNEKTELVSYVNNKYLQ